MLKTAISGVTKIAEGTWEAEITPAEVDGLGRSSAQERGPSVLLVGDSEEAARGTLLIPNAAIRVLNRGTASRALILAAGYGESADRQKTGRGDDAFLAEASQAGVEVEEFARRMLAEVRKLDPHGDLVSFPGRRFINKPDNFIVLVPQPRIHELKVVVRGRPTEFRAPPRDLKADQNGYSTFKIADATGLASGIALLHEVRRKQ